MIAPIFIYNLSRDTYDAFNGDYLSPKAYLLAPNNATKSLADLSIELRKRRRGLLVDNGNFSEINRIRKKFKSEAAELYKKVHDFEIKTLGRSTRNGELPEQIQAQYLELARQVKLASDKALLDDAQMLEAQLSLNPSALIGTEDIRMASWLSLNIERAYTNESRRHYRAINHKVAKRAATLLHEIPSALRHRYYPVASAVSFNTAVDAGREFAKAGIRNISMGFGAYMADNNFVDHIKVGRKRLDFGSNLPARYIRTVAVAEGFWEGYEEILGKPPIRFHFLGLGAPIMFPLIALCCHHTSELSFDATSPIKDATRGGTLYVEKPAPLKVRIRKAAYRIAKNDGVKWDCPCPFCTDFLKQHPFNYKLGRQWFLKNNPVEVAAKDLKPNSVLFNAFPLFSEPAPHDNLRKKINFTRIGHNHWVIERILTSLKRADARNGLDVRVNNIMSKYTKNTSPPFAKAIEISIDFVRSRRF
jgi:hypothetical protein